MTRALLALAALAATVAVSTAAAGIAETVVLAPKGGSKVTGTATVASPGDTAAAAVRVKVKGLKPGALARIQLNAVAGKRAGAGTVLIVSARADAKGSLVASGRVRYRGAPVPFSTIADGDHAISVLSGGRLVARGIIPGMS